RFGRNVLGPLEIAHDEVLLVRSAGRQRETAVSHDDARHSVPARARPERIPCDLCIHVSVAVDEAGSHDAVARVELLTAALEKFTDARDPVAADPDIRAVAREPGAIDHGTAADHEIVRHVSLQARTAPRRCRAARGRALPRSDAPPVWPAP